MHCTSSAQKAFPNPFTLIPYHGPDVISFLYWLCAWADPRYREQSEALHNAACQLICHLINRFSDVPIRQVESMRLVRQLMIDGDDIYLRINDAYALRFESPWKLETHFDSDVRRRLPRTIGLTPVEIACEELPEEWDSIEGEHEILGTSFVILRNHDLGLSEIAELPALRIDHPWVQEFRRALSLVVGEKSRFTEIRPEQWSSLAWRRFHCALEERIPGVRAVKPLGAVVRPFSKIIWDFQGGSMSLKDASLHLELNGPSSPEDKLLRLRMAIDAGQLRNFGFTNGLGNHEVFEITDLRGEVCEHTITTVCVPIQSNILICNPDGLVNLDATETYLRQVLEFIRDFLTKAEPENGTFQNAMAALLQVPDRGDMSPSDIAGFGEVLALRLGGLKIRRGNNLGPDMNAPGVLRPK